MWIIFLFIFFLSVLLLNTTNKKLPKAPPGPRSWPMVGNLIDLGLASPNPILAFAELSKRYGPIYSLKVGMKNMIVISSKPILDSLYQMEELNARDKTGMMYDRSFGGKNLGISLSDGKVWEENRKWILKTLKSLGFSKSNAMEHFIGVELEKLFERIDNSSGELEVENLLGPSLMAVSYQIVTCQPLNEEDERNIKTIYLKNKQFTSSMLFGMGLAAAFPFIRYILPGLTGRKAQTEAQMANNSISKKLLEDALKRMKDGTLTNEMTYADAFAKKMIEEGHLKDSIFHEENFQLSIDETFLGSADTASSFLKSALLFLILHPELQQKLYEEISKIIPPGENITFSDLKRMPFVQAFTTETFRMTNVTPNLIPRLAIKDFMIQDYQIKKGDVVMPDMYSIYNDKEIWENPSQFNPMRFMEEDGKFNQEKSYIVIPFGTGTRKCPGELYGTIITYLFLTKIVQRYKLRVPSNEPLPRSDMCPGLTCKPYPYRLSFQRRSC